VRSFCSWFLALLLASTSTAQDSAPVDASPAHEPAWIVVEPEVDLQVLLKASAESLGIALEFDPEKVSGRVALQPGARYAADALWQMVSDELVLRGLTTVQLPGSASLRVVALTDGPSLARLENPTLAGARAGFVRALVPLLYRSATEMEAPVKLLLSRSTGSAAAVREGNALLLADTRPQLQQALFALSLLDAPGAGPLAEEVELRHISPASLVALVERLAAARQEVDGERVRGKLLPLAERQSVLVVAPAAELSWWTGNIERFDVRQEAVAEEYRPRRFGLAETAQFLEQVVKRDASVPWKLVRDNLTGSLLITTTPRVHDEVRRAITRLESTAPADAQPLRSFVIRHRRVGEVLALLEALLAEGVLERTAPATEGEPPADSVAGATPALPGGTGGPIEPVRARGVTLSSDEGTNRLIAFGEARLLDQLERLVDELDVRSPQVLIEALVVTLTRTETLDLGVELRKTGVSGDTLYELSSLFGLGAPDPSGSTLVAPTGAGASGTVLSPGDWSAVVRALEVLSRGRTQTSSRVLVQNNHEATLDSVLQTPYASTNASTTVATTSFGGTLDAGTTIAVKPQVAEGDRILLEYAVSLSSFVGAAASPTLPPPRKQDVLKSVVAIPDGFAVVVGGLEIESEGRAESQVPVLGDLPLLGHLFEDRSDTSTKSRLFVFLRCTVMSGESYEHLRFATEPALEAARLPQNGPRLEPRIMR